MPHQQDMTEENEWENTNDEEKASPERWQFSSPRTPIFRRREAAPHPGVPRGGEGQPHQQQQPYPTQYAYQQQQSHPSYGQYYPQYGWGAASPLRPATSDQQQHPPARVSSFSQPPPQHAPRQQQLPETTATSTSQQPPSSATYESGRPNPRQHAAQQPPPPSNYSPIAPQGQYVYQAGQHYPYYHPRNPPPPPYQHHHYPYPPYASTAPPESRQQPYGSSTTPPHHPSIYPPEQTPQGGGNYYSSTTEPPPQRGVSYESTTPSPAGQHVSGALPTMSSGRAPPPDYVYLPNTGGPPPPHYHHHRQVPPPQHHMEGAGIAPPHHHLSSEAIDPSLIYDIRENDVLCGRGAPTTYHPGNQYFKELVAKYQPTYIASRRSDKPQIASQIVEIIRGRGGRFLKRTKKPGMGPSGHFCWEDVGDQRAYEKACQSLRENAPELRRRLAAEEIAAISVDSDHGPSAAPARPPRVSDETADSSLSGRKRPSQDEDDPDYEGSSAREATVEEARSKKVKSSK